MIIQEKYNEKLIKTYSNNNKMIRQNETGILYDIAIDIPNKYTYIETDIEIEKVEEIDNQNENNSNID